MKQKQRHSLAIFIAFAALAGVFGIGLRAAFAAYGDTTTFVGKVYDGDGGKATEGYLDFPEDIAVDGNGNFFVADTFNNVIRKIATDNTITTFAGTGASGTVNGAATDAQFARPKGIAVDSAGNVYVADTSANLVRKITVGGSVSTLLSGLTAPEGLTVFGETLYIADTGSNRILRMSTSGGEATVVSTNVHQPVKLAVTDDNAFLYVADRGSRRVLKITTANGSAAVIAGSGEEGYAEGIGVAAKFQTLGGVDLHGNTLYVTDGNGFDDKIRTIDLATNQTALLARDTAMAVINFPRGIAVSGNSVYTVNSGIGTISVHEKTTGALVGSGLLAGKERFGFRDGSASTALLGRPHALAMSRDRQYLYLAENNKIRRINRDTGDVTFVIGNSIDNYTFEVGTGLDARFSTPSGIAVNAAGDTLYVTDRWNNRVRGIAIAAQSSFLVAGGGNYNTTGPGNGYAEGARDAARFDNPTGIAISPDDVWLYVADTANNRIRKVRIADGQTFLVAGSGAAGYADGTGAAAQFNAPYGLTIDAAGQHLYVADRNNHLIRRIRLSDGSVTTVVGSGRAGYREAIGTIAVLNYPLYVSWGGDNRLYFTDAGSHRVRLVELATATTKLVAGSGARGFANGGRTSAKFDDLAGLMVDVPTATLFVADAFNDLLRRVNISGTPPYADPAPIVSEIRPSTLKATTNSSAVAYLDTIGAGFRHGAKTSFGNHAATTYVKGDTSMTTVIPHGKMAAGWYDVEVVNLDGQSDIQERAFGIKDASGSVPNVFFTRSAAIGKLVYPAGFTGGVLVASGDVDGDGLEEIITGTGPGGGPHIRVFDGSGNLESQFFAYATAFRGGVTVAAGDVNGDGIEEIITGTATGAPHVRIFSKNGTLRGQFFAYATTFRNGVTVAAGDVDGDGFEEIVTGTRGRSAPHVRVFDRLGRVENQFFAYPPHYRLGIIVSVGDVNGDRTAEIITTPFQNGGPHVRVLTRTGALLHQFFAYASIYRGGVATAVGDVNGDGLDEIITGTTIGNAPHLRVFTRTGVLRGQFFPFSSRSRTGINVAAGDVNGDGVDDIIAARASGTPEIVVTDASGNRIL